tara:strand:+ start:596 stop:1000 length:405 start_codon:yes stop_codon:yes gene_type:complete
MTKKWKWKVLSLVIISSCINPFALKADAGVTTGADIYCIMRQGGNDHETSWMAAYTNIKKQRSGIFKTSPRQAANTIVENVVADPIKYEQCVAFLGDLYKTNITAPPKENNEIITGDSERLNYSPSNGIDRYSY